MSFNEQERLSLIKALVQGIDTHLEECIRLLGLIDKDLDFHADDIIQELTQLKTKINKDVSEL